jgi:sirohydrochlorin cobaltochelatase
MRGIVLFGHGSREAEWARPFEAIRDRLRRERPEYPVAVAYLEHMAPTLDEAIGILASEGASSVTVFPIFIAQGGHLRHDLPRLVEAARATRPHLPIALEPALGDAPEIVEAIVGWIWSRTD